MEFGISDKDWEVIPDDGVSPEKYNEQYYKMRIRKMRKKRAYKRAVPTMAEFIKSYMKKKHKRRRKRGYRYNRIKERVKYIRKKARDKRPKVICLYGPSGSGKTLGAAYLGKKYGIPVICSYTTRPMRPKEKDGVDHYFVKEVPSHDDMLAYTKYGGYEYWALKSDADHPVVVYVVDEVGISQMQQQDYFRIYPLRIERTEIQRRKSGVSEERIERDRTRPDVKIKAYRKITNNQDKILFYAKLRYVYGLIVEG